MGPNSPLILDAFGYKFGLIGNTQTRRTKMLHFGPTFAAVPGSETIPVLRRGYSLSLLPPFTAPFRTNDNEAPFVVINTLTSYNPGPLSPA